MIRLRECAGWSAPVLFANPRKQVFSRRGPYNNVSEYDQKIPHPKLQTNPRHREEELQDIYSNKTTKIQ